MAPSPSLCVLPIEKYSKKILLDIFASGRKGGLSVAPVPSLRGIPRPSVLLDAFVRDRR